MLSSSVEFGDKAYKIGKMKCLKSVDTFSAFWNTHTSTFQSFVNSTFVLLVSWTWKKMKGILGFDDTLHLHDTNISSSSSCPASHTFLCCFRIVANKFSWRRQESMRLWAAEVSSEKQGMQLRFLFSKLFVLLSACAVSASLSWKNGRCISLSSSVTPIMRSSGANKYNCFDMTECERNCSNMRALKEYLKK